MMKKLTLIFAVFLFLASCASVDKLVEKGDYDGAVLLAIKKLQGKKKKKTKHVVGLEEAFAKINKRDLTAAKRLLSRKSNAKWDNIYDIYVAIDERQTAIEPLLPLISKDGYQAKFSFINVNNLIVEAASNAANYQYTKGIALLKKGKKGDKEAAREAYTRFMNTKDYADDFKKANKLAQEALYYGKTRVLVEVENKASVIIPAAFEREILSIHVRDLNTKWTEYYVNNSGGQPIDVNAILEINDMRISPEREEVNYHTDSKKIKDGFEYVLDDNGNVQKDTSGNDIKVDKYITIFADVTEVFRSKSALVKGNVFYYDNKTGERFRSHPVKVEAVFEDYACQYRGDRRALDSEHKRRLKSYPSPFPSDFDLTMDAAVNLKEVLKDEIDSSIF